MSNYGEEYDEERRTFTTKKPYACPRCREPVLLLHKIFSNILLSVDIPLLCKNCYREYRLIQDKHALSLKEWALTSRQKAQEEVTNGASKS